MALDPQNSGKRRYGTRLSTGPGMCDCDRCRKRTLSELVDDAVNYRPLEGPNYMDGRELIERCMKGEAFPYPLDDLTMHYAFGYKDREMADQARYDAFMTVVDWLFSEEPYLFSVLERTAMNLARGHHYSATLPAKRSRGRPRIPEKHVDDITTRLRSLRRDDEARRFVRNAASMCIDSDTAARRERAKQERMPTEEEIAQRHATYFMLRDELERFAVGSRLPRLANVLLFMLDAQGTDRKLLVAAAERAGVLKSGSNKRKNLADVIGAIRKELDSLDAGQVLYAFSGAWWPREPPRDEAPEDKGSSAPEAISHPSGTPPDPNDARPDSDTTPAAQTPDDAFFPNSPPADHSE